MSMVLKVARNGAMPRVSVITVVYNLIKNGRRDFMLANLHSVHGQAYDDIEHIVVDGASTDGTVEWLSEYVDKGWIKLITEPDNGVYDAMNKGIRNATGKYVAFLNSDDFWYSKNGVSCSVSALESSQADYSFAPSYTIHNEIPVQRVNACIGAVFFRMPFCHQTMFTKRDVLLAEGGFDNDNFHSAADFNLIQRINLRHYRGVFVPTNFTAYRHGGMSAEDHATSDRECIKSIEMVFSKIDQEFGRADAEDAYFRHRLRVDFYKKLVNHVSSELKHELLSLPKTQEGSFYLFGVSEYSTAVAVGEIDHEYPGVERRKVTWKALGIPIARYERDPLCCWLKVLGVVAFRREVAR